MTTEEKIWQGLKAAGCNDYGAAGMMGNLYAESALRSNNLQNAYEKKLGMGDDAYTAAVDNGKYTGFVNDSAGYGIAQWTYHTRKAALLDFAKKMGKSIGDLDMQIAFLVKELGSYAGILSVLKSAKSVREASDKVLTDFERPADQSEAVKAKRAGYGQTYYDKYAEKHKATAVGGNSSLVDCTIYSPNHSGKRTHTLDTLTPHCVVGQCSAERVGEIFKPTSRQASCNYAIGYDGRVCLIVDECNRSWCTSSNANDQRAITIECASDTTEPYAMNSKVYEKLILLCADICRRNGKTKVLWLGSKEKTLAYTPKADEMVLTAHRWFANKSCPGEWLYSRYGDLAARITAMLSGTTAAEVKPAAPAADKQTGERITKMAAATSFDSSARGGKRFKVNSSDGLNVRYGPDANKYAIITALKNGEAVTWHGYYAMTGGAKWLYVAFGNKTGWVHSAYLK